MPAPRFMHSTRASRAQNTTSLPSPQTPEINQKGGLSKHRSIMTIANKPFVSIGRKSERKIEPPASSPQVSSPFGFQRIDEVYRNQTDHMHVLTFDRQCAPNLISSQGRGNHVSSPEVPQASLRCMSPLDKPLPSLPVAIVDTKSPKVRRLLIDATEKPLRQSLSTCATEEWPALSPEKPRSKDASARQLKKAQLSLGESVIERMKKLNINENGLTTSTTAMKDDKADAPQPGSTGTISVSKGEQLATRLVPVNGATSTAWSHQILPISMSSAKEPSSGMMETPSFESCRPAPAPPIASTVHLIAQPPKSGAAKRLSSTQLSNDKEKRPRPNSVGPVDVDKVTTGRLHTTRPAISAVTQHVDSAHFRSRSRHCVNAQGSPYATSRSSSERLRHIRSFTELSRRDSTSTSSDHSIITGRGPPHKLNSLAPTYTHQDPRILNGNLNNRKSSIPVPSRMLGHFSRNEDNRETRLSTLAIKSLGIQKGDCDAGVGTSRSQDHAQGPVEGSRTKSRLTVSGDHRISKSTRPVSSESIDTDLKGRLLNSRSKNSTTSKPLADKSYNQDEHNSYTVRPLNHVAPEFGPKLRISESASDYLLGRNDAGNEDSQHEVSSKRSSINDLRHATVLKQHWRQSGQLIKENLAIIRGITRRSSSTDTLPNSGSYHSGECFQTDLASEDEEQVPDNPAPAESAIVNPNTTSAPPIKCGTPKDTGKRGGWPFEESIVAPFRQIEPHAGGDGDTVQAQNKCSDWSPSSAAGSSAEQSTKSAYTVGEFLKNIEPPTENRGKQIRFSPSTDGLKTTVQDARHVLDHPPRTSSRRSNKPVLSGSLKASRSELRTPPPVIVPHKSREYRAEDSAAFNPNSMESDSQNVRQRHPGKEVDTPTPTSSFVVSESVTTGKGVISNIRGLFHKSSNDQSFLSNKLHHSLKATKSSARSPLAYALPTQPLTDPTQSQYSKKASTTTHQSRHARKEPKPFGDRRHRDVATITPTEPLQAFTEQMKKSSRRTRMISSAPRLSDTNLNTPTPELQSTMQLVHSILDRARDSPSKRYKSELIELCKTIILIISHVSEAEKAKEEAVQASAKAEIECLKIRKEFESLMVLMEKKICVFENGDKGQQEPYDNDNNGGRGGDHGVCDEMENRI